MKARLFYAVLFVSCLLSSCGGGSGSSGNPQSNLTSGNWAFTAMSTPTLSTLKVGGNLVQSGNSVSAIMHIGGTDCLNIFGDDIHFSGKFDGANLTLKSLPVNNQVITVKVSGSGNTASGTYSVSGGCANGDNGSISGIYVGSISGTWKIVSVASDNNTSITGTATLVQGAADAHGQFPLTGNISVTGNTCFSSGQLATSNDAILFGSKLWGDQILIVATPDPADFTQPSLMMGATVMDPLVPTKLLGSGGIFGGTCPTSTAYQLELDKK